MDCSTFVISAPFVYVIAFFLGLVTNSRAHTKEVELYVDEIAYLKDEKDTYFEKIEKLEEEIVLMKIVNNQLKRECVTLEQEVQTKKGIMHEEI